MLILSLHIIRLLVVILIFTNLGCSLDNETPNAGGLNEEMKNIRSYATQLFLYAWTTDSSYSDLEVSLSDSEKKEISELVRKLRVNFHEVGDINDPRTNELGFKNILSHQNNLLSDIETNLQSGHTSYALWQLKGVTHNCFYCHSRLPVDQDLISQRISLESTSFESRLAESEFLVASRQFSLAEEKLLGLASDMSTNLSSQSSAIRAVKLWLLLQIRVKTGLAESASELDDLSSNGQFSAESKDLLSHWAKELRRIQVEISKKDHANENMVSKLEYISSQLGDLSKRPMEQEDDMNLVKTIYASSLLHQLLFEESTTQDVNQQVLGMLGVAYSRLNIQSLGALSQTYFSECIEALPHSKWAKICFIQYQENFDYNHTGSGGLKASGEDRKKLEYLKGLAS